MRLVDADALKEHEFVYDDTLDYVYKAVDVLCIDESPTIDAVPVVRCKDCIHGEKVGSIIVCRHHGFRVNEYMYCSGGEKDGDTQ